MIDIPNVYSVGELNSYLKNMFAQDYLLQKISVRGEVSNCKYHTSGHIYFTLKDSKGVVDCVMFAGKRTGLSFRLSEGQQVIVSGSVNLYERDGRYQLYANRIQQEGSGLLYEKFERLKRELEESGMFAQEYKQPIPRFIRTLGVVTAETGAAVRDVIQVARRRNPCVQIVLYPAIVQGAAAAPSIVRGIHALERLGVDVMIVGRGGGSMEDLWAFNEREVAQAVFDCSVPVISAVGHETDFTIIDFVSDKRAPTPSAAAELAVTELREVLGQAEGLEAELKRRMQRRIQEGRRDAGQLELRLKALSPVSRIREKKMMAMNAEERLQEKMNRFLQRRRNLMAVYVERLKGLSPLEKLNSGYSFVVDEGGRNVRSVAQVSPGQKVAVRVSDGRFMAEVTEVLQEGAYGRE